jgi:hypothetical protein
MINKRALLNRVWYELCNSCAAGLTKKINWHKLNTLTTIGISEDDVKGITGFLFVNHIENKILRKKHAAKVFVLNGIYIINNHTIN